MAVAGASQFRIAAQYTQLTGQAAQPASSLLSGAASILDVGRGLAVRGVGLSNTARQLNQKQLDESAGFYNNLFSNTIGATATVDGLKTQINALRAQTNFDRLSRDLQLEIAEAQTGSGDSDSSGSSFVDIFA